MIVEDAFDCPLEVGSLVTYAMKREGGIVFPVCRVVAINEAGWVQLEFEPKWLNEFNGPGCEMLLKAAKEQDTHPDTIEQLMKNILGMRKRTVSPKSCISIEKHPAFEYQEIVRKHGCACVGLEHHPDCFKHEMCL